MGEREGERISQISTMWTVLMAAHSGDQAAMTAAQQLLLERYGPPIKRYLSKLTGSEEARDDLWQEFATRLIQGDFRKADPSKGRFRSYLKTVLVRMAQRHQRLRSFAGSMDPEQLASDGPEQSFDSDWRAHLLDRVWMALRDARPTYEQVLRIKTDSPALSSPELADKMQREHGISWSPETLRQNLHRARQRFGELLIDEVCHSVDPVSRETVEAELAELELLTYCGPWLDQWSAKV